MSKIHCLIGHDCKNSSRDSVSQTELAPADSTTRPSRVRAEQWDPVEKGMRDISSGKSEVSHVGWWQISLAYCEKGSKDNPTTPPARTWIHFLGFPPEHSASCWKPSEIRRSDLASYLSSSTSSSSSSHPGGTSLRGKSKLQVVVWAAKESNRPTDLQILRDKYCYKMITLPKTTSFVYKTDKYSEMLQ